MERIDSIMTQILSNLTLADTIQDDDCDSCSYKASHGCDPYGPGGICWAEAACDASPSL